MAVLLVRLHRQQLLATPSARRSLLALHARLHDQVQLRNARLANSTSNGVVVESTATPMRTAKELRSLCCCHGPVHVLSIVLLVFGGEPG